MGRMWPGIPALIEERKFLKRIDAHPARRSYYLEEASGVPAIAVAQNAVATEVGADPLNRKAGAQR
jgi:hypothetical protein